MKKSTRMLKSLSLKSLMLIGLISLVAACSKEDVSRMQNAKIYATDAAIDHANVEAVVLTVTDLYLDGSKVEGFQTTSLEVSSLTEGKTQLLKELQLDASAVSKLELVLDYDTDAAGLSPGCYVKKVDGSKDQIKSSTNKISLVKNMALEAGGNTDLVVDFDLRKIIVENSGDFELVSETELNSHIRTMVGQKSGMVKGKINSMSDFSGKAVAYIYKKGSFDLSTETQGQGQSSIQFANASNSATVNSNGEFTFGFVEEGMYEIHVFEYKDEDNDGRFELSGKAQVSSSSSVDLSGFGVEASSTTSLDLSVDALVVL